MTLTQLAQTIEAELIGDGSVEVIGCAPIDTATANEVTFLANAKYGRFLDTTNAAAVILDPNTRRPNGLGCLIADDPYFAFRGAMIALHGFRVHPTPADAPDDRPISARAAIHPTATIGERSIIHPFVVIERNAAVGADCVLYPGAFIGVDSVVGDGCVLYPGVAVYDRCRLGDRVTLHANTVIGQDGFGYATHQGKHHKIPQGGVVVIEDDVELGAGCAIERASMGETRIGRGTKFADLISIGHGTTIGDHCLLVSLSGVSGSVKIGKYVVLGGQVGVAGHLTIGDYAQAAGKSGIMHDIPDKMRVAGQPAIEFKKTMRNVAVAIDLAELAKRVRRLEQRAERDEQNALPTEEARRSMRDG